jgi:hypothetical protein
VPVATAGGQSIGIAAIVLRILDAEIVEIDRLIRLDTAERHHHVHKKADAVLMTRCHQSGDIHVRSG